MKQTLIEKYIDGTTTRAEEQQLLQLLQSVPEGERTKQEEALLLMLTPRPKVYDDEIFNVNPKHSVNLLTKRRLRYASLALVAVAASIIVAVLFFRHHETLPAQPKQEKAVVQQIPTEKEQKPQIVVSQEKPLIAEPQRVESGKQHRPTHENELEEDYDPHYAWARSLIDNYHEDEEVSKSIAMGDNKPSQISPVIDLNDDWQKRLDQEWAANDIQENIATIKSKGKRLQRRIEEKCN